MTDTDTVFLVLDVDADGEIMPVIVCATETVAKEIADRIGGKVDVIMAIGLDER